MSRVLRLSHLLWRSETFGQETPTMNHKHKYTLYMGHPPSPANSLQWSVRTAKFAQNPWTGMGNGLRIWAFLACIIITIIKTMDGPGLNRIMHTIIMVHGFFSAKVSTEFEFMTNQMYIIFTRRRFMCADLVVFMVWVGWMGWMGEGVQPPLRVWILPLNKMQMKHSECGITKGYLPSFLGCFLIF